MGGTREGRPTGDDASGVDVTLSPRDLGAPPADAAAAEPAGLDRAAPGRRRASSCGRPASVATSRPGSSAVRQTVSVQSTATGPDGAWLFARRRRRPELRAELLAAPASTPSRSSSRRPPTASRCRSRSSWRRPRGRVSGVVVGPGGPLGNVDLVLTDGTLDVQLVDLLRRRGRDLLDHGRQHAGHVHPDGQPARPRHRGPAARRSNPGEQRERRAHRHDAGVGSISGRVTENGEPLGGVTLTASNGDDTQHDDQPDRGRPGRCSRSPSWPSPVATR